MKFIPTTFLVFVIGLLYFNGKAQDNNFIKKLEQKNKNLHQEKVHIHFDKPLYVLGDTVWFQGYVVSSMNNVPSDLSNILYVDVINGDDQIVQTLQLPLNFGFAPGSFILQDTLRQGQYKFRAYTDLIRQSSSDYFFLKKVNVINPYSAENKNATIKKELISEPQLQVQFFPEGGQLINGIKSSIGFKAIGDNGMGVSISGFIVDELNNHIAEFKSGFAGMGSFSFLPLAEKKYIAIIKCPDGSEKKIELPKTLKSGYVISADNLNSDTLYVTLHASLDLINKGNFTFVPLSNGEPLFYMQTKFPDQEIFINIPKNKLPGGIIQLALLNENELPVSQRLIFNPYLKEIKFDLNTLKATYSKREAVNLDLQNINAFGRPTTGSFSISVANADEVLQKEELETTIFSNLLLSSDLKGHIEQPNYYFTNSSSGKEKELDNLMLTQGWTRFLWESLTHKNDSLSITPEHKIVITGHISALGKTKINGIPITLLAGELINGALLDTVTNDKGAFKFYLDDNLKYLPMRLQVKTKSKAEYKINVDEYQAPEIQPNKVGENVTATLSVEKEIEIYKKNASAVLKQKDSKSSKAIQLKDVNIRDYDRTPKLPKNSTSSNLAGGADKILTAEFISKFPTLEQVFLMLPGIIPNPRGKGFVQRNDVGNKLPAPILILVDGIESDLEVLSQDVESVEFLKSAAYAGMYGIRGAGGVIIVTTKKGNIFKDPTSIIAPNSLIFNLPLYVKKEFYSPKYAVKQQAANPDLRTTVFWRGDVITNADGKAKISYFNNDVAGNYRIVIEGISAKGELCRQVFNYKIE